MSAKLDKLKEELDKAYKRKERWDARVKELEARVEEAENAEITEMVHSYSVTPEQLKEMLKLFAEDTGTQPMKNQNMNEEEIQNED